MDEDKTTMPAESQKKAVAKRPPAVNASKEEGVIATPKKQCSNSNKG